MVAAQYQVKYVDNIMKNLYLVSLYDLSKKLKNFKVPFHRQNSTVSELQSHHNEKVYF